MLKKFLAVTVVLASAVLQGGCGLQAESQSTFVPRDVVANSYSQPNGAYEMAGPIKINLKVPGIITANVSSPDMGVLGSFVGLAANFSAPSGQPGNFTMNMNLMGTPLAISGMWATTTGTNFKAIADLAPLIAQIEEMGGQATIIKNTFTGKVLPNGQLKGTFGLGVKLVLDNISATLNITANYVGRPVALSSGVADALTGPIEPIVLNGYFATMFEKVVNVAKQLQ